MDGWLRPGDELSDEPKPLLTTPVAVVLAGALVGLGLYLGLRGAPVESERGPERAGEPAPVLTTASMTTTAPPSQPPVGPSLPAAVPSAVDPGPTLRAGQAALTKLRAEISKKCWPESANDGAEKASYKLDVTFDAQGKQIARGLNEPRHGGQPGVGSCIQRELPPLTVDPPGQTVRVELVLELP